METITQYERMRLALQFLPREYRNDFTALLEEKYKKDEYFKKREQATLKKLVELDKEKPPLIDTYTWQCEGEHLKQAVIAIDDFIKAVEPVICESTKDGSCTTVIMEHIPVKNMADVLVCHDLKKLLFPTSINMRYTAMGMLKLLAVLSNLFGHFKLQINPKEWQPKKRVIFEIEYDPSQEGKNAKFRIYTK